MARSRSPTENILRNRNERYNIVDINQNRSRIHHPNLVNDEFMVKLKRLHSRALQAELISINNLQEELRKSIENEQRPQRLNLFIFLGVLSFLILVTPVIYEVIHFLLGVRCFVPNNYLIWEATRPLVDCSFCRNVRGPLILKNLTREEFAPHAYSSTPIIIKKAVLHWPAINNLNYSYLKNLYLKIPGALDEDCQFLHFRSDFTTLRDVFRMSEARSNYLEGNKAWYVGFSNCHTIILDELRKLYPRPHFLPEDAEMPNTDYIFLGYEQGAIMHLDYIPRLMWQAQLQGNKSWMLAPTPECEHVCHSFSFFVEPGDAVLVDTRIWYHATTIPKGQFALTIQSEYG